MIGQASRREKRRRRIVALTMILQDLTGDEIDEMIREADLDGDGKVKKKEKIYNKLKKLQVCFAEFATMMSHKTSTKLL